jgi:SAM-dependent methyltransferase
VPRVLHAEFRDPRLAELYDAECPWGPDDDYFLAIANETPNARVLDLGCGTGRLTLALAAAGHTVTGVDPATASLERARAKPGAERVTWVEGTSEHIPNGPYDVAFMTSHVAQFLVTDDELAATLEHIASNLTTKGRLVFDSRDPADRRWERWNPTDSRNAVTLPNGDVVTVWTEVTAVHDDGRVEFTRHYAFPDGTTKHGEATLRFRTLAEIEHALNAAGFAIERVHGGWHREPVGQSRDGELVVTAIKSD